MGLGGMIYMQRFVNIGTNVEGILRFCPSNLKSCNVGITRLLFSFSSHWHIIGPLVA
jgi:hypothetical protein